LGLAAAAAASPGAHGAEHEEFKVKRQAVFEFAEKPRVTRDGDRVTISFAAKGYCDVTVAIEDSRGKIVRHLASGVLGVNAPAPLARDSKTQTVVWDGKDDQGVYVDDKENITVRVSLGLKPRFEKTLFWSPHKRLTGGKAIDADAIRICARPEGVYVSDGTGVDSVRLFDHQGNYVRTIYPFAADKLKAVQGLNRIKYPQTNRSLPLGAGMMHATLLTSGSSSRGDNKYGYAAQFIAVHGKRMAIGFHTLNRLGTDGSSGGLPLVGPRLRREVVIGREDMWSGGKKITAGPRSAAFSPDGKRLYLSGYGWCGVLGRAQEWLNGVAVMDFASDRPPRLFAGSLKQGDYGKGNGQFKWATSVAVDSRGRVYVADHLNSRIQVFSPAGKFLKAIAVARPTFVGVHHRRGEIVVLSWRLGSGDPKLSPPVKNPKYVRLGPLEDPKVLASCPLKVLRQYGAGGSSRLIGGGMQYVAALDTWARPPTIWLSPGKGQPLMLLVEKNGKLEVKRDFAKDIARTVVRAKPPIIQRQRLYVNPADGALYVAEGDCAVMKGVNQLLKIDPKTGRVKRVDLPMAAEDFAIDLDGRFYLRTDFVVARFDPATWREIPWDYGEERKQAGFKGGMEGARRTSLMSALVLPATGTEGWWHLGGMAISPNGHLAVTCCNKTTRKAVRQGGTGPRGTPEGNAKSRIANVHRAQKYKPRLYPGRAVGWEIHIWDKHGKLVREDAAPGLTVSDGIGIDKDDNLYVLASPNRVLNGKPYPVSTAGTLVKIKPGRGRFVSGSGKTPVPLAENARPERPLDVSGNFLRGWAKNVEWMYGGVGLNNMACICWNARPALDLFARSFAPEINHFSVAVLDANGNLILRIGRYGNTDDGNPLVAAGGPPKTRAIGGDEVALAFAAYLATHTDRRLFVADAGNSRIVSVRLGYHAEEKVRLRDVPDVSRKGR
jgi:hypothetical protein